MRRDGKFDGKRLPAHVRGGQRLFLRVRERPLHTVGQPLGEGHAVLLATVVVLAGADVSAGAVEVNVQGFRNLLAADESRDPREVGAGNAGAIITLRVTGVITEHRKWPTLIPERQQ